MRIPSRMARATSADVTRQPYGGAGGSASVVGTVDAEYFVQKVCDAIPGTIDDMILKGLLAAVK